MSSVFSKTFIKKFRKFLSLLVPKIIPQITGYFFKGLTLVAPTLITIYLLYLFLNFVDDVVKDAIPIHYHIETYLPFRIPGLGLAITFILVTILGAVAGSIMGRIFLMFGERAITKIPLVRTVYGTFKQMFKAFSGKGQTFSRVVSVPFPTSKSRAIGFVTGDLDKDMQEKMGMKDSVSIFVPTTPNPTSGFLLFMEKKDVQILNMATEEAAQIIVFAGIRPDKNAKETEHNETEEQLSEIVGYVKDKTISASKKLSKTIFWEMDQLPDKDIPSQEAKKSQSPEKEPSPKNPPQKKKE